jgi:hypothetical protein
MQVTLIILKIPCQDHKRCCWEPMEVISVQSWENGLSNFMTHFVTQAAFCAAMSWIPPTERFHKTAPSALPTFPAPVSQDSPKELSYHYGLSNYFFKPLPRLLLSLLVSPSEIKRPMWKFTNANRPLWTHQFPMMHHTHPWILFGFNWNFSYLFMLNWYTPSKNFPIL